MAEFEGFTPSSAAIKLSHWLDAFSANGHPRFPVDVRQLALAVGSQLRWADSISTVNAVPLDSFEGGLFELEKGAWALLYNEKMTSPGRIRFTQAHELGHFLLHRKLQSSFECSEGDLVHWGSDLKKLESEADEFAALLLMPLTHFRRATSGQPINLEALSMASYQFGVSLTAAALRWIKSTEESAVLILSRDGYIDWSVSSDLAFKNGVFIRTKGIIVELPGGSLAADDSLPDCKLGERVPLKTWFEHAHASAVMIEMKLVCVNYGYTLSLLHLSPSDKAFKPGRWQD
jgi:hypothetical protein